jgi:hypothetical protein
MIPALDVMMMRVRVRALEGDEKTVRALTEIFGCQTALVHTLKVRANTLALLRPFRPSLRR